MTLFFVMHSTISVAVAFLLALFFGQLTASIAAFALFVGFVAGRAFAHDLEESIHESQSCRASDSRNRSESFRFVCFSRGELGWMEVTLFVFVLYASFRHFLALIFPAHRALWTLNVNNFGDLPLHINFIRQLASGHAFPPLNPSFAAEPLRYPFAADFYNSLWEAVGVPLSAHLFIVGMIATVASLIALRVYAGWWAIGAFFLSGGLSGIEILAGKSGLFDVTQSVEWKNFFVTVFLTQRGFLFALPIGLTLLYFTRRHFSGESRLSSRGQFALGLAWGVLPFFHAHGFVIVSLMMGAHAVIETLAAVNNDKKETALILALRGARDFLTSRMALTAYLPAVYFVLRTTDGLARASVIHFDGWWMGEAHGAIRFMARNFGLWLLLPSFVGLLLWSRPRVAPAVLLKLRREFLVVCSLFFVFFNLMLAPWAWDNVKILVWPYLGLVRVASVVVEPWLTSLPGRILRLFIAFGLFASGVFAVVYSLQDPMRRGVALYQVSELAWAQASLKHVPVNSVFAAAPTHHHVLTWFGRVRAIGYEGHLWSHGIRYEKALALHERLMRGDADWLEAARKLGVTHIFWGQEETKRYGASIKPWMSSLPNVSRASQVKVYVVQ